MSATTSHGSYLTPSIENATVADAMHPGVLFCDPDATATEVARTMATHHVHCVVVMGVSHDAADKLVWGLISDMDVLRAAISGGAEKSAATLAAHEPLTVEPSRPLRQAAEMMVASNATHVIVIDPRVQRPVGVLSTLDIAGTLAWGEG
jgi:CBS domain-containing protein